MNHDKTEVDLERVAGVIAGAARSAGFATFGVADVDLEKAGERLRQWIARGYHGEMGFMQAHGSKRFRPAELVPGTVRCLSFTMNYLPEPMTRMEQNLREPKQAYIARYALGRDYHRLIRRRLQKLALEIEKIVGPFGYRVFCDSAPVMEKPLAGAAGLGWIGKHTNLIDRRHGSWFFLGEIYTDLPLPMNQPVADHCGSCSRCIEVCPTGAIVAPYVLDARLCISYLTIEHKGDIPENLRPLIGNRIFGCDDCQLFCPWNRFARRSDQESFMSRGEPDSSDLVTLFLWTEAEYLEHTEGSALRRTGYQRWLRNVAVALGNAPASEDVVNALKRRSEHPSAMVRRHVAWALLRHGAAPAPAEN